MTGTSSNIELELTDGTACAVLFSAGKGLTVSCRGEPCGTIDEDEVGGYAARRNGAMELAAEIEGMFGQQALTSSSQDALMDAAYRWFEQHF